MNKLENEIKIYRLEKNRIILEGNHKSHALVRVTREADIFGELDELVKFFRYENFDFRYSPLDFSDETIKGLDAYHELYHNLIGKYNNLKLIFSRQLSLLEEKIREMKTNYADKE